MPKKTKHAKSVIYVPYFTGYRPRLLSLNLSKNESHLNTTLDTSKKICTMLTKLGNEWFLNIENFSFMICFSGNFHECDKSDIPNSSERIRKQLEDIIFKGVIDPIYEKNPTIELYVQGSIICSAFIEKENLKNRTKVCELKLNLSESKPYSIVKPALENYINSICKEYEVALNQILSNVYVKNFVGIAWPSERVKNDLPIKIKNFSDITKSIEIKIGKKDTVVFFKSLIEIFKITEPLERGVALKNFLEHLPAEVHNLVNFYEKEALESAEIIQNELEAVIEKNGGLEVNNMPGVRCSIL